MQKSFHIYRSSAGSGKTRTLSKEYIKLALRHPDYYRYILAMTFTNKSTQEMKDRVIRYLHDFANGKSTALATEIINDLKEEGKPISEADLADKSREVLNLILHKYSYFSISTIDAFFQKVIRSFTRETGLLGNFRLEVDNDMVLAEVIDSLMDEITDNDELRDWIVDFSLDRLEDGKDWDVRSGLLDFSNEIFKEEFKIIEEEVLHTTTQKDFFKDLRNKLRKEKYSFENYIKGESQNLLNEFKKLGLVITDFKWGAGGSVYAYLLKLAEAEIQLPGQRTKDAAASVKEWTTAKSPQAALITSLAEQRWQRSLNDIIGRIEDDSEMYFSVDQVLRNLYAFGLLSDISRTLKKYLSANNLMLLADAPKFLRGIMQEEDTSFIYEKVGSFYRHFLIDEFQDTSGFQWDNLKPLIKNGLAQNYKSLIVGDIKQSIYRWRGGDLSILQHGVKKEIGEINVEPHSLDNNFRSLGNVVSFNNALFETASHLIGAETQTEFPKESYHDAAQKIFRDADKGYVEIQFIESATEQSETPDGKNKKIKFEDQSLELLIKRFEHLQESGISVRDIAMLVRDNSEGQRIAQYFMQYSSSAEANPNCKYTVVSNESLRLDQASCVLVLVNAMRLLNDPKNNIASAHLAYEYQKLWPAETFPNQHKIFSQSKTKEFARLVPLPFTQQRDILVALPLIELAENLIYIFNLGKITTEIAYLQSFQDLVIEFSMREKSDLASFLQWWDDNKHKKSIQVANGVDAAQIITIHKSKGLQFKYVMIPFLNWELNHSPTKSPILWCKSAHPLFKDAGYLPLRYTSKLENTVFNEFYQEERKRIYLDNLNLLYVAFTRAEEGMIVHAPDSKSSSFGNVGHLVKRAIDKNEVLQSMWSAENLKLTYGAIETIPTEIIPTSNSLILSKYQVTPWRDRLRLRTRGREFFEHTEKRAKINYGIFIHTLMARVNVAADVHVVTDKAMNEGLISLPEQHAILETMHWIVQHPMLKESFAGDGIIKTEASLIIPDGSEKRIDRISIKDKDAFLIDYKTGDPSKQDVDQVKEYLAILKKMGYEKTTGFLVYVNERKCIEVSNG